MKYPVTILFFLLFVPCIWGQQGGSVTGRVIKTDGAGVSRSLLTLISVSNNSVKYQTRSDAEGEFRFDSVPPGEYHLQADGGERSAGLFGEVRLIVSEGIRTTVNVTVGPPAIRETVTVAADLTQPIDEVAKTVNVIGGQEMRDRADFSLAETLRSMPGIRVQQLGGFGRTANIKTRGLRNQDTALLIDGVRLRDASAITGDASPFLSDVTLTSVSSIEVLRGSGSSLYGTNSIGGTINFITPTPTAGPKGQVSYAAGGLGLQRFRGNLTDAYAGGRFGFNAAVARTAYTKGIDGNDDAFNTNFQARLLFQPVERTSISGRFFVSDAYVRLNSNPDTLGVLPPDNGAIINARAGVNFAPDADDPDNTQKSRFFLGHISFSQVVRTDLLLAASYSGLQTSRRNDNGPLGIGFQSASTSIFDGTIQTANGVVNWSPGAQQIRLGYEFENERFGNDGLTPTGSGDFFTRASQSSSTVFAQDLAGFFQGRLQLAGGFRAQVFKLDSPRFSLTNAPYSGFSLTGPSAAVTFDGAVSYFFPLSGTKLRAHIGNGYRVPSLYERFGTFFSSFGTPGFVALGDPVLKPERTIAFDGGVEQYLGKQKVRLSAVYFYTDLRETIGFGNVVPDVGTTPRPFGGYMNQKGGIARGGEFSGSVKPSNSTDLFASYSHTKSLQRQPQVSGSGVVSTLGIPEHQFTLVATQRFRRAWVNLDLLVSSSYLAPIFSNSTFNTYVYRFEGNRRGDLTAGYTFKLGGERFDLRLFGTIENLFNNEYFENGFRTAGRNGRIGLSFGF